MIKSRDPSDAAERLRAIDPGCSFIVQAPAGSGKTGLLIQRYLRLLVCVNEPEEIVAITFTRKAAAEMRERIVKALDAANGAGHPGNAFDKLTYELATAVMLHDQRSGWKLVENPMRLRIQTIDALCASLTRQMPVLSKFGSQPEVSGNVQKLYREAARATIALLDQDPGVADDIAILLEHLDNDIARIESLLASMLARRDHWLRHIHGKRRTRDELESSLGNIRNKKVAQLHRLLPDEVHQELLALLRYAAANLTAEKKTSVLALCDGLDCLPNNVDQCCGIAELLLKTDGQWRDRVDARQGFPAGKTKIEKETAGVWKERFLKLLDRLKSNQPLQRLLCDIRSLPPPAYNEEQWKILGTITRLLPLAVVQLKIIFQMTGQVDFTEIMQSALAALGESEKPTDLALALDYRIKHILVDEFQDTSISQYRLIEKLIAGWEPGDGRSLFAVGDPMQSIYRFREAEVGLFLQARQTGIGHIDLHSITLRSNFRSQRGIVDWINDAFKQIMPVTEDVTVGAVTYAPAIAMRDTLENTAVTVYPAFENDRVAEAEKVLDVIVQTRVNYPGDSIAVLVRNRSHLSEIVASLQSYGLRFHAVEIDALSKKPVVQDLLMLTRALLDPADRLAWLAILRAPWCGLQLDDLQALASIQAVQSERQSKQQPQTILELINANETYHCLSCDGARRLKVVAKLLTQCIGNRYRQSLRATVEAVWLTLGGPGCVGIQHRMNLTAENQILQFKPEKLKTGTLNDAMVYLDYLEAHECACSITDWDEFEEGLSRLFAAPDTEAGDRLQIMTIHKAKGLEFDTVLLPGLGYSSRNNERQLLRWMEQPRQIHQPDAGQNSIGTSDVDLFLAPIQRSGRENDTINFWLESLEREKEEYEVERLLYVAATRAKKYLHLFGHVSVNGKNIKSGRSIFPQPRAGSLLNRLWPAVGHIYINAVEHNKADNTENLKRRVESEKKTNIDQSIIRLESGWQLPEAPAQIDWQLTGDTGKTEPAIEFSWAGELAKHVGSVVHRWLQQIAEDKLQGWTAHRINTLRKKIINGLLMKGISNETEVLEQAVERVVIALVNSITDKRGRWILGEQGDAQNELKLTGTINGKATEFVIDRTFCDNNGVRWIIDYKTSSHEGSSLEEFLDMEQKRYTFQLNSYAALFQKIEKRPICLGLYFPMMPGWRTWVYSEKNP